MPDYNKGDFTQQGIDGFVEGGLHLNEKRCLTARISTDENSAGLDSVEINIHDHLNDLDYTITGENLVVGENTIGGGGGHLATVEFEENGTYSPSNYEAYGFGEVTVNVSGGGDDVPVTTLTVFNDEGSSGNVMLTPADTWITPLDGTALEANAQADFIALYNRQGDITYSMQGSMHTADFDVNDFTNLENITVLTQESGSDTMWLLSITDPSEPSARTVKLSYLSI